MKIVLKYPCRLGSKEGESTLYPKGTELFPLSDDDPLVLAVFPNMKITEDSEMVAVRFPDRNHVTIVHITQIEKVE